MAGLTVEVGRVRGPLLDECRSVHENIGFHFDHDD